MAKEWWVKCSACKAEYSTAIWKKGIRSCPQSICPGGGKIIYLRKM